MPVRPLAFYTVCAAGERPTCSLQYQKNPQENVPDDFQALNHLMHGAHSSWRNHPARVLLHFQSSLALDSVIPIAPMYIFLQ